MVTAKKRDTNKLQRHNTLLVGRSLMVEVAECISEWMQTILQTKPNHPCVTSAVSKFMCYACNPVYGAACTTHIWSLIDLDVLYLSNVPSQFHHVLRCVFKRINYCYVLNPYPLSLHWKLL
ncbi:hypothetical protein IEQ34_013113 [Dendrobium chrysotoxum]|uniref:Uncharacterized protein n=1 Tax=Dendrobium chrysotoxum TaxID=161865 RepID=A0AAV7GQ46_DENCH|nr:hypothetical protein IEQ34_013113 [Dendrobium chrysotoxum]